MRKKIYSLKLRRKGNLIALIVGTLIMVVIGIAATSCKAQRTITTTATYVQQDDSTKTTTTISTKTLEEYTGIRKK